MRGPEALLAALLLWSAPAAAQDEPEPEAPVSRRSGVRAFTSERRTFACELPPSGWQALEEETAYGSAAHFLGPAELGGAWRAAIHVHFIDKAAPGFVPIDDAVKRERRADALTEREAGSVRRWRVAKRSARRFEVSERRLLPADRLPAALEALHHFYAFVPAGDGYFIVKMSTSRERYLEYRDEFERLLASFRILGYP